MIILQLDLHEPNWSFRWTVCSWIRSILEVLKQVIFEEKGTWIFIIFSDHVMTNVEDVWWYPNDRGSVCPFRACQRFRPAAGEARLFVSNDFSKEELEALPHVTKVSMTKQGLWRLILGDASAGLNYLISQGLLPCNLWPPKAGNGMRSLNSNQE